MMYSIESMVKSFHRASASLAVFMVLFSAAEIGIYPSLRQQVDENLELASIGNESDKQRDFNKDHSTSTIKCNNSNSNSNSKNKNTNENKARKLHLLANYAGLLRRLARIKVLAYLIHRVHLCMALLGLVQLVSIDLIGLNLFADFHYLDCFILGRFRFFGRSSKISGHILLIAIVCATTARYVVYKMIWTFKFYAAEFLLYDYEEVLTNEVRIHSLLAHTNKSNSYNEQQHAINHHHHHHQQQQQQQQQQAVGSTLKNFKSFGRKSARVRPITTSLNIYYNSTSKHQCLDRPNSTFCLKNPFYLDESDALKKSSVLYDKWILRPNRTSQSWKLLNKYTLLALLSLPFAYYMWYCMIASAIAGSIWTDLGFEISYPTCVEYIQRIQQAYLNATSSNSSNSNSTYAPMGETDQQHIPYSNIYLAPRVLASQMNIDDIPASIPIEARSKLQLNLYSWVRIVADLMSNFWWYTYFIVDFPLSSYWMLLCSFDLIINARAIRQRLKALIKWLDKVVQHETARPGVELAHHQTASSSCKVKQEFSAKRLDTLSVPTTTIGGRKTLPIGCAYNRFQNNFNRTQSKLEVEIANIQALLVDHFDMVKSYNAYNAFLVLLMFIYGISHSLLLIVWMSTIKSQAVEREFLVTEISVTMVVIIYFSCSTTVRTINYRLYELIMSAMALDQHMATKMRWITIEGYYKPKSLFCFTLFGSTQISWLFCLKFIAWMASVFVVLANFYYMRR